MEFPPQKNQYFCLGLTKVLYFIVEVISLRINEGGGGILEHLLLIIQIEIGRFSLPQ